MDAALTIAGAAHLWFGCRALRRARARVEVVYGLCIALIGVFGVLWPARNGIFFDRLIHVAGAALLLRFACLTLGLMCGFASLSTLIEPLSRWHRAALVAYGAVLVALLATWRGARAVAAPDSARLLYGGYYGIPPSLLAWNIAASLASAFACAALMVEMTRVPHAAQDRQARVAMWIVFWSLFGAGVGGALSIAGQALASRLGFGATAIVAPLSVMVAIGVAASPILNAWSFYLMPTWRHARRFAALWREARSLRRVRRDMAMLLMLLSDRLAHLLDYTDPTIVEIVAAHCRNRPMRPYRRGVALEAARWIVCRRAVVNRRPWPSTAEATRRAVDERIVIDAARRARSSPYLYADVYLVVILALGPQHVPAWLELEHDPRDWHRALAALVANALDHRASAGATAPDARTDYQMDGILIRRWVGTMIAVRRPALRRFSPAALQLEVTRLSDDLTGLRALCDDLLVYLRDRADPAIIHAVADLCRTDDMPSDQSRVACEVARWVGFFQPDAGRGSWEETIAAMGRAAEAPADTARQGMGRMHLLANTGRVIMLVLSPEQIPVGVVSVREWAGWRRRVARLIRTALSSDALAQRQAPARLSPLPSGTERT